MPAGRPIVDWQDAAAYAWLEACGRAAFAWEWLRRRADYVDGNDAVARRFGLHRWERPDLDARAARPLWCVDVDPFVLTTAARPCPDGCGNFEPARLGEPSTVIDDDAGEHWLFGSAARGLRLDVRAGTLRDGPVALTVHLSRLHAPSLSALGRLVALARDGGWRLGHFAAERRAKRWALVLRVHDALEHGARQRDIADCLFGTAGVDHWRIEAAPVRRRTQRLVEAARRAAAAKPAAWLDGTFP
jgi:hypothetical protein